MANPEVGVDRGPWAPIVVVAGLVWAVAPAPTMVVEPRIVNVVYVVPIALMIVSLSALGRAIAPGPISLIGYLFTGMGLVVNAIGSILEGVVDVATLAQWGLAQGQVFYLGLFVVLVGAVFLGVGLWRETGFRFAGPMFFLVMPVTVGGFWGFTTLGMTRWNWVPITVPYGVAWVFLGYELRDGGHRSTT
ncbi:MAG: hypothetical protein ABEJ58_01495 [Halodesulfurarchaeum sp.]